MGTIGINQNNRKLSFRDFAVEWRINANINRNDACRHFNANPQDEQTGNANREVVLFCANRVAEMKSIKRPFKNSDSVRRFESFNEDERELIIESLNFLVRLTKPFPDYFSVAERIINL
ncbi:hypothetical protein BED35_03090 [Yersinia enterocolitica]|uniref:hypothetical protein n=1 Tax=Yersinia enterocolitica TaxID=630 RepID=UPI000327DFB1|nr:hypothetical protein [Yersinia enterocolitica]AOF13585.1 hypothetical protein BB936_02865 [Yersinia enterocolitica]AOF17674.1 hypothetical protein BED34_02640 [Yersinia enterocolitica]AOF22209.1 hypothetical protein BED33_05305 [Yersinia enterocolitica]AOF25918.1 hypothetical protein BED32_02615 [Yersinia enterocolitica]AOF30029.1 hypothetical protein BED35_03090 [Yersinia enterocolitica]